ncbi:tetraacyldisaccharide 4'-kinase [Spirosoma pollinicola]|uniref:Tetraacyldisaccharide 4'-kinase n=1 Tax=Spirosoma pollinicola TaxID=2057025 RepID=A0A2K8YZ94_9BACT|nr:tetraacyldisaccharide 4'-kinase [Spirosoma pollinicola]AUD02935.1 tetraacyldisaccharide 4'-kinase [Spirosoma pollinicola]
MKRLGSKWLLLPFSLVYGVVMDIRNWLFNSHLLRSYWPSIHTICVGNLTVGGTGKTPMIEFLIKRYALSKEVTPGVTATLSRGYGRQTTGFRIATDTDTASTIGDEPLQLYRKFAPLVRVCVGERRAGAIQVLVSHHPETKQVLLDDAYQHRAVQPHLTILLMDYNRPFYDDYPFPAGRLRERRKGARRADVIVVTKCPTDLFTTEQQRISEKIRPYCKPETPIFFAGLQYGQPVSFESRQAVTNLQKVVLVSGLANADLLEYYVDQAYTLVKHHRFADHYAYSRDELDSILTGLPPATALLTTEKDWVKLDGLLSPGERTTLPLYYLPVAMQFLPGHEQGFNQFLDRSSLKNR